MKKKFKLLFIVSIVCILQINKCIPQNTITNWKEQIDFAKNKSYNENEGDLYHLKLINYNLKGTIKTEIDKSSLIDSLFNSDAPFILQLPSIIISDTLLSGDTCMLQKHTYPKFEIITIREILEITESIGEKNPIPLMRSQLEELIKIGFDYLELEWNYKGKTFYSLCFVSNEYGGVVYDPIASYIHMGTSRSTTTTAWY